MFKKAVSLTCLRNLSDRERQSLRSRFVAGDTETLDALFLAKGEELSTAKLVSAYLLKGADLMLPGVARSSDRNIVATRPFEAGMLVSVRVPGNQAPFAVGRATMPSHAARAASSGVLLELLHFFGDALYAIAPNSPCPNSGFGPGRGVVSAVTPGECCDGGPPGPVETGVDNGPDAGASADTGTGLGPGPDAAISVEADMDALIDRCVLTALHTTIKDNTLPLAVGALWLMVLAARPAGTVVDIKASSFKRPAGLLNAKAAAGWWAVKKDSRGGELIVTAVNRAHQELTAARQEALASVGDTAGAQAAAAAAAADAADVAARALDLTLLYKAKGTATRGLLSAGGADADALHPVPAITAALYAYLKREGLDTGAADPACVRLDGLLCDALMGKLAPGQVYPEVLHRRDLLPALLDRMQPHVRVSRGGRSVMRSGPPPVVTLVAERRAGNKKVSRVAGLECYLLDPASLAAAWQSALSCSVAVDDAPGGRLEVVLQGAHLPWLTRELTVEWGIPANVIQVSDKTKDAKTKGAKKSPEVAPQPGPVGPPT